MLMYKYLDIHMRLSTIIRIRLAKRTRGEVAINRDRDPVVRTHMYIYAGEMREGTTHARLRARARSSSNVQTSSR